MESSSGSRLGHYEVSGRLGKGGMGEVYRARDTKLKREVALKVLPAHFAEDADRRMRFEREAQSVAALNHPNIVTIYSVEEEEGVHFLTMELVEGESLDRSIPTGGVSLPKFFEITVPLADALAAAHEKGITHRDLKPANIMVTENGRVKVLDFGLAKLQEETNGEDGATQLPTEGITQEGKILGTVAYMSPEQAEGKAIDSRSDIFSLGIVLYEMATGRRPFSGDTNLSVLSSILREQPSSATDLNTALPRHLGRVIRRCLEKDPNRRYQSVLDVRNELDDLRREVDSSDVALGETTPQEVPAEKPFSKKSRIGLSVLLGIALVVALFSLNRFRSTPAEEAGIGLEGELAAERTQRTMIAILPLRNLGAPEDAYFAAGMTDELSSRLGSVGGLGVISSESTIEYADTTKPTRQIGEELGVEYLVSGTVRWARGKDESSRVRISPKLIRVEDDTQIWSEIYDRQLDDIFAVQTEIAQSIIGHLRTTLLDTEKEGLAQHPTDNLEAYQAYLRGTSYHSRSREDLCPGAAQHIEHLERATSLDLNFAAAWAALSRTHSTYYTHCLDGTQERKDKVVLALQQAERLAPNALATLLARRQYLMQIEKDFQGSLQIVDGIGTRVEQSAELSVGRGYALRRLGRWDESIESLQRALRLNPRRAGLVGSIGFGRTYMRSYSDAIKTFDTAIAIEPKDTDYRLRKAVTYWLWRGDIKASRRVLELADSQETLQWAWYWQEIYERRARAGLDRVGALTNDWLSTDLYYWPVALYKAIAHDLLGEKVEARKAYEIAQQMVEVELERVPGEAKLHRALSVALAGLGRKERALLEAREAMAIYPIEEHPYFGATDLLNFALVANLVGDLDSAFEALDTLLSMPSLISIPLLELDPRWAPLRSDPRFEELAVKYGS